jgi:hypothetical protein
MTQRPWESKEGGAWLRRRLAEDLGEGVIGVEYPSQAVRYELNALLKLTAKRKSRICEGNGLFAVQELGKGTIVGVSGGVITETQSQWTVELTKRFWVDGYPTGLQDVTQYGYINEDIWKQDGHNCAIGSFGVIVATRVIRKGEELLMNYGENWVYWNSYKIAIAKTAAWLLFPGGLQRR